MYNHLTMNSNTISFVSAVSHTETALERASQIARQFSLLVVTLAAFVVAVGGYAWTAFALWREEHGEAFAASAIRTTIDVVDGLADLVGEARSLAADVRVGTARVVDSAFYTVTGMYA